LKDRFAGNHRITQLFPSKRAGRTTREATRLRGAPGLAGTPRFANVALRSPRASLIRRCTPGDQKVFDGGVGHVGGVVGEFFCEARTLLGRQVSRPRERHQQPRVGFERAQHRLVDAGAVMSCACEAAAEFAACAGTVSLSAHNAYNATARCFIHGC
jgi:hypothetical protein